MTTPLTHVFKKGHAGERKTFCGLRIGWLTNVVLPRYLPGCTEKQWNICEACEGRMALLDLAETSLGVDDPVRPAPHPRNPRGSLGPHWMESRTQWRKAT